MSIANNNVSLISYLTPHTLTPDGGHGSVQHGSWIGGVRRGEGFPVRVQQAEQVQDGNKFSLQLHHSAAC